MNDGFIKQPNKKIIRVQNIVTVLYLENSSDFSFAGEKHDFWEFAYVDKGSVIFDADGREFLLRDGELVFHKPNEFHMLKAAEKSAPNISVISFVCNSSPMRFFENKIFKLTAEEKKILRSVLKEGLNAFEPLSQRPPVFGMKEKSSAPLGAKQMAFSLLEYFLITLLRRNDESILRESRSVLPLGKEDYPPQVSAVFDYMTAHACERLSVKDFADAFSMSESAMKKLFFIYVKRGVTECFNDVKLNKAKMLIRENELNLTEISDKLEFSSVHYFSRFFKKNTGMTPTEYRESVKD